jgi:3'-5' exonuclease
MFSLVPSSTSSSSSTTAAPTKDVLLILDHPSRFDKDSLLSGPAGEFWNTECYERDRTEVICLGDKFTPSKFKAIFLAGPKSTEQYLKRPPGYAGLVQGVPAVGIFAPQDCCDHVPQEYADEDQDEAKEDKDFAPTRHKDFRFLTTWYVKKLLKSGAKNTPTCPPASRKIAPQLSEAIQALRSTKKYLYFDIETSVETDTLNCIGFRADQGPVYVVPIYTSANVLAYGPQIYNFWKVLAASFYRRDIAVVGQNLNYDLLYLHHRYRLPIPRNIVDTLIINHRLFPEVPKSLMHLIAQWTAFHYHKGNFIEPRNSAQERQLYEYNAQDVYCLQPIMEAQLAYADTVLGARKSIAQACDSLYSYMLNTCFGVRIDVERMGMEYRKAEAAKAQWDRVAKLLIGNLSFNPGSSPQCAEFFHTQLGYDVIARSEKTNLPTLNRKALYKLAVKYDNPVIPFIIRSREVGVELGMLKKNLFSCPWNSEL